MLKKILIISLLFWLPLLKVAVRASDDLQKCEISQHDRDGDGIPNHHDFDPMGWIYDCDTGEIIEGGQISVTGPGTITIMFNGASAYYRFSTNGTPEIYALSKAKN